MNFLIIPNNLKQETLQFAAHLIEFLYKKRQNSYLLFETTKYIRSSHYKGVSLNDLIDMQMVIIIGGDGTVLKNMRALQCFEIPVLGINFGHLGYMTECEPKEAFGYIEKIINGEYKIEERIMLNGNIYRASGKNIEFMGLNEAVIYRGGLTRALNIELNINESYIETFSADGAIIATPNGSTAYNLSAGGPILMPTVNNLVITPICSHTRTKCALVASGDDIIDIKISNSNLYEEGELVSPLLVVDSCEKYNILESDEIEIRKAPHTLRLVKIGNASFYKTLQKKISQVV